MKLDGVLQSSRYEPADVVGFFDLKRRQNWDSFTDDQKRRYLDYEFRSSIELYKVYFNDQEKTIYAYILSENPNSEYSILTYYFDDLYRYNYAKYHVSMWLKYISHPTETEDDIGKCMENLRLNCECGIDEFLGFFIDGEIVQREE